MRANLKQCVTLGLAVMLFLACSLPARTIKIASINPLTGDVASSGLAQKNAVMMATEEWNSRGGILGKQIEVVYSDTQSDADVAARVTQEAIEKARVVAIIGPTTSATALPMAELAQRTSMPMIAVAATNSNVTAVGDYIFRACFINAFQASAMADYLSTTKNFKTAAILYDAGNEYAVRLSKMFQSSFLAHDGSIVANIAYAPRTTDFREKLAKIIEANPDVLYIPNYYNDVALIAKAARELGFTGQLAGGDGWDSPDLEENAGASVEGAVFTANFTADDTSNGVPEFVARYKDKYGVAPNQNAALAYVAANVLYTSIKNAGGTAPELIRAALTTIRYEGITGTLRFDEKRNPLTRAVIIEIHNGEARFVKIFGPQE